MLGPKLDTLLSVAETLSFTKTAALLNLTQPAVSQHIKALEEELGAQLFYREKKELKLTDEGIIVIKYAKRMRSVYANLLEELKDQKRSLKRLVLGVTPTAEHNIISEVLAIYSGENANTHIKIISDTINNLYAKLKSYEIHVAVVEGNIVDPNYNSILLDTDYLVLAVSNDNPLSRKEMVTLNELKGEKLILRLPDSGTRTLFETALVSKGESIDHFRVILEVDNTTTIKDLIRSNFGVTVISRSACVEDVRKNKYKILPIENLSMIRELNIIYRKDFEHVDILNDISKIYHDTVRR